VSYLSAAFVIGLLIAIHELGHLAAAKLAGIPVERFSIGFGPKLVGFERGGTSYWLAAVPFGGYVLPRTDETGMLTLPFRKELVFALGGPLANVVTGYAGLVLLGLVQADLTFVQSLSFAGTKLSLILQQLAQALAALFSGTAQVSGIVGIVAIGGSQFGATLVGQLQFAIAMSINLAVVNLLPLPPLDGGRIVLSALETIHRPFARFRVPVTVTGWVFVLSLMLYATYRDIERLGGLLS